jgi:hypothetical protein
MTITALPTPPSRDDPANFATRADAFLGALPDFATEANALAAAVNADEIAADASATAAASSASAAASSASSASSSASAASSSASAASASASAAAASYDSFDDRYLGAKSSDPSVDNDGNALITGALYFNTTANEMRVYSGSAWVASYLPAGSYLTLTGGTMTGNITFAAGQSFDASKITGSVAIANGGTGATTQSGARTNLGLAIGTDVQAHLVSGTNIKTVNSSSLLGSGNLSVGTVTSVGATAGTGISVSGSPITSSGSLTITNTGVTSLTAGTGISVSASTGGITVSTSVGMTEITSAYASSSTSYSVSLDFNAYKYYTLICTAANTGSNCDISTIRFNNDTATRYSYYTLYGSSYNYFTGSNSISNSTIQNGGSLFLNICTRSNSALGGVVVSGGGGSQSTTTIFSGGYSASASITSIQFNATGYWILYGVK